MEPDTKTEADVVVGQPNEGEGKEGTTDTVSIPKKDYETMNQTIGSLKRELKDLKKSKEENSETKETSKTNQPEESVLLKRLEGLALRQAGLTHQDDIELARNTAKKWGIELEQVLADEDFKVKLDRQQTARSNAVATSNIRGGQGTTQAKNTPEYWVAKGVPPTPADVPDRKTRAKIIKSMMALAETGGKKFYNE